MSGRLRSEGGFTLPELLTTMWIAGVIMLAAFALVDFVMKRTAEAEQRVEATQRGRTGMDLITRQLRSQVCVVVPPATSYSAPVVSAADDSVTFYGSLNESSTNVEKCPTFTVSERAAASCAGAPPNASGWRTYWPEPGLNQ